MRIRQYTLSGAAAANNAAYASAQHPTANTPLTLLAAAATISPPRELTFFSAANLSAITFTIVGKDRWGGNPITETIAGPTAGATVRTRKIYSSITSITPDTTDGVNNIQVGFPARVCSPWVNTNAWVGHDTYIITRGSTEIVAGTPAGTWEFTDENVAFISGDGAFVDGSVASTPAAAGDTANIQGAYVRYVLTSTGGTDSIKARFARAAY